METYNWILIKTENRSYVTWSNAVEKPHFFHDGNDTDGKKETDIDPSGQLEWVDWRTQAVDDEGNLLWDDNKLPIMVGRPLPTDIDNNTYVLNKETMELELQS